MGIQCSQFSCKTSVTDYESLVGIASTVLEPSKNIFTSYIIYSAPKY